VPHQRAAVLRDLRQFLDSSQALGAPFLLGDAGLVRPTHDANDRRAHLAHPRNGPLEFVHVPLEILRDVALAVGDATAEAGYLDAFLLQPRVDAVELVVVGIGQRRAVHVAHLDAIPADLPGRANLRLQVVARLVGESGEKHARPPVVEKLERPAAVMFDASLDG